MEALVVGVSMEPFVIQLQQLRGLGRRRRVERRGECAPMLLSAKCENSGSGHVEAGRVRQVREELFRVESGIQGAAFEMLVEIEVLGSASRLYIHAKLALW